MRPMGSAEKKRRSNLAAGIGNGAKHSGKTVCCLSLTSKTRSSGPGESSMAMTVNTCSGVGVADFAIVTYGG